MTWLSRIRTSLLVVLAIFVNLIVDRATIGEGFKLLVNDFSPDRITNLLLKAGG